MDGIRGRELGMCLLLEPALQMLLASRISRSIARLYELPYSRQLPAEASQLIS